MAFTGKDFLISLGVHLLILLVVIGCSVPLSKEPTIEPIELTVVVNENLNGVENEPPPEKPVQEVKPKPPPKTPDPKPVKKVEDPPKDVPALEQVPPKPTPKPKPEKPKEKPKTEAKTREQRLKEMRDRTKDKPVTKPPKNNGKTQQRPTNWKELLNQGYKPSNVTQVATGEDQRCVSLITMALNQKWSEISPRVGKSGEVLLELSFDRDGSISGCNLAQSCGDAVSDKAALSVARSLRRVNGLSNDFLKRYPKITIRYTVKSR